MRVFRSGQPVIEHLALVSLKLGRTPDKTDRLTEAFCLES